MKKAWSWKLSNSWILISYAMTPRKEVLSVLLLVTIRLVWSFMEIVPFENVETCYGSDEPMHLTDHSALKIVAESDEDFYLNGTMIFLKELSGRIKTILIAEQWHRDTWVTSIESTQDDTCAAIEDEKLPTYQFFKDQKKCPLVVGVSFKKGIF